MKHKLIIVIAFAFLATHCKKSSEIAEAKDATSLGGSITAEKRFPDYCALFPVPEGTKETFEMSQDYPDSYNKNEPKPWEKIDFTKNYDAYLKTVLAYCMEGNVEVDFKVQNNPVRKWYSAPWMHDDGNRPDNKNDKQRQNSGRECLHGLTREITIQAGTLGTKQVTNFQTYAIAFYNEPGGYTIGKVWKQADNPDMMQSTFPEGTVSFKLLFTEADTLQVPYLANSKKWTANIFTPEKAYEKRTNTAVRLLQLDIAVKDERATTTNGWVYGTFIYDASKPGKDWLSRMVPVGLSWGDDSDNNSMLNVSNKYNPSLKQSVINQKLLGESGKKGNQAFVTHLGMGGRMNGPVDNAISSCISCHGRAALKKDGTPASIANFTPGYTYMQQDFEEYFKTISCGVQTFTQPNKKTGIEETFYTTDYSFQLANGIRNFVAVQQLNAPTGSKNKLRSSAPKYIPMVSRDGSVD
jgi:hypothetical protein